jgi:hypothetical protein
LTIFATLLLGASFALGQEDSGRKFSITLSGAAEVPGPGDADGSGTADVRLNQGQNQICFELSVSNIAAATAAHIHEGAEGASGPPVVTLTPPAANGTSKGCVDASADLIKRIRQTPENFYVNVHNAEFPNGAVRGQLAKKAS